MDDVAVPPAVINANQEHYALIAQMVAIVSEDRAQLRQLVYELARRKLRRDLYPQFEEGDWTGISAQMQMLEAAIDQVEVDCARKAFEPPLAHSELTGNFDGMRPDRVADGSSLLAARLQNLSRDAAYFFPPPKVVDGDFFSAVERIGNRLRGVLWWQFQLMLAALLGIATYAAIDGRSLSNFLQSVVEAHKSAKPAIVSATRPGASQAHPPPTENATAASVRRPDGPSMPLPGEYGAFAYANGQLAELELLPMRVPDQRVAISPAISSPSRTHLSPGKLEFVLFRRDLANTAPDRIAVRVIAKVVRALTFDPSGKAATSKIADTWVVRSNAYQMRVAPVAENPEMITVRPDPPDLALPAGRYALVLKGAAYDFTIDGTPTDAAHCLERTDALASPIYTECRIP